MMDGRDAGEPGVCRHQRLRFRRSCSAVMNASEIASVLSYRASGPGSAPVS
jgi:hypothetical protein